MDDQTTPTFDESAYLRGRETAFKLAIRQPGEEGPPAADCPYEMVWLRLGSNEVARIEEEFAGVSTFSDLFENRPVRTVCRVLCIAMREPTDEQSIAAMGLRLFEEEHATYLAGVEAMWMLSHGGTEEEAGKAWRGRLAVAADRTSSAATLFDRILKEVERASRTGSRGRNGSASGRKSDAPSKSSGG